MNIAEAKKWVDRLVEAGGDLGRAEEEVQRLIGYGSPWAEGILALAVESTRYYHNLTTEKSTIEPVEIPRRVVVGGGVALYTGKRGTVVGEDGACWHLRLDNGADLHITKNACIELQLTKTEQARLLLEGLSKEAWKGIEGDASTRTPHWLTDDGMIDSPCDCGTLVIPYGVATFPEPNDAINARNTIVHAGLAWWEEGE